MRLSEYGCVAHHEWSILNERFPHIKLDAFQIMPNHMHGIIHVGPTLAVAPNHPDAVALNNQGTVDNNTNVVNGNSPGTVNNTTGMVDGNRAGASSAPTTMATTTIGGVVGAYKSLVANDCLKIHKSIYQDKMMGKLWQRNYYEHIIRNEKSYNTIRDYIISNPAQWQSDSLNPIHKQNNSA
jgi:putative transposase